MQRTVDYAPLLNPIDPAALRQFKALWKQQHPFTPRLEHILLVSFAALAGLMFLVTAVALVFAALSSGDGPSNLAAIAPFLLFTGVLVVMWFTLGDPGKWQRRFRLSGFAAANGLLYRPQSRNPNYPGAIFGAGSDRESFDHISSAQGRFLDYGNYRWTTGSGKNRRVHQWGFLALQLDRSLPHMMLDARANDTFLGSTLPVRFQREQRLSLEGGFDRHFTLYCPKQYERDALYVFTPDLMALLIDEAAPFDVEVVDRWLFVYSPRRFDMAQPALHQRLLRIVDTVGAKALSQTDRYSDERIGDFAANIVAPQGKRLRRGAPVAAIVIGGLVVALWLLPQLLPVLWR